MSFEFGAQAVSSPLFLSFKELIEEEISSQGMNAELILQRIDRNIKFIHIADTDMKQQLLSALAKKLIVALERRHNLVKGAAAEEVKKIQSSLHKAIASSKEKVHSLRKGWAKAPPLIELSNSIESAINIVESHQQ